MHLYSQAWPVAADSLYAVLNDTLSNADRGQLVVYAPPLPFIYPSSPLPPTGQCWWSRAFPLGIWVHGLFEVPGVMLFDIPRPPLKASNCCGTCAAETAVVRSYWIGGRNCCVSPPSCQKLRQKLLRVKILRELVPYACA